MNKEEALKRDTQARQYVQKNKLRALFAELTREVLLKRPDDPINFLIDYIEKRNKRSVICLQGYDEEKRTKLATSLSNKFNFFLLNLNSIFGGEEYHFSDNIKISEQVIAEIRKVDKIYRGIIISGFPNNAAQADALQKSGVIPERYFLLYNDQPAVRQAYLKRYSEEEADLLMDRNSLELKELKTILSDQYDQLPLTFQKSIEKMNATISIRLKKVTPLQAPRIIIMHPPYIVPKTLNIFSERYSLHWVTLEESFRKASKKQDFIKFVGSYVRQHKSLSKEIELALIETQSKSSAAKNKGLLLSGWPTRSQSLPFLKLPFLNPHLIIIFTAVRERALEQFSRLDPNDSEVFAITQKPTTENYKLQLKDYQLMVDSLKSQANCQLVSIGESEQHLIKLFESQIQNSKIYS